MAAGVQPRVCKIKSACLTLVSRPCLVCPHPHGPLHFLDTLPPPSPLPVLPGSALAHFVQTRGLMSHVRHAGPRVEVPLCLGPQVDTQVLLPPLPSCRDSPSCSLFLAVLGHSCAPSAPTGSLWHPTDSHAFVCLCPHPPSALAARGLGKNKSLTISFAEYKLGIPHCVEGQGLSIKILYNRIPVPYL